LSFEEQSFENMVWFYKEELVEIDKGNLKAITQGCRHYMTKHGILTVSYQIDGYKRIVLSQKTREFLEQLLEEEK